MNGLDLEPFLRLLRADPGAWLGAAAILGVLGALAWTSWGSRKALRKCLVLSIAAHAGLLLYGYQEGLGRSATTISLVEERDGIREIRVRPTASDSLDAGDPAAGAGQSAPTAAWDRPRGTSPEGDKSLRPDRLPPPPAASGRTAMAPIEMPNAPPATIPTAEPPRPEIADLPADEPETPPVAPSPLEPPPPAEVAVENPAAPATVAAEISRTRPATKPHEPISEPERPRLAPIAAARPTAAGLLEVAATPDPPPPDQPPLLAVDRLAAAPMPAVDSEPIAEPKLSTIPRSPDGLAALDLRDRGRPDRPAAKPAAAERSPLVDLPPVAMARREPDVSNRLPPLPTPPPARPLPDVPEVYRPRLDPQRMRRAIRNGASVESEQAVERALAWLARHQDADGRWNAGTRKYSDDTVVPGEANFTQHCPPGDICAGECFYWEADSAMTGLSLLAYLGAGYTHTASGGKYTSNVAQGLQYLLRIQKPDGDLRGESYNVGMYCHAMATLSLCEAYALSGDARLRSPAERAVNFLVESRAADSLSWRYTPGAASGDTSLLGWVILVYKSAQENGIAVPNNVRTGAISWLARVAEGPDKGLAVYRPNEGPYGGAAGYVAGRNMTPTMTAEAWVCRQFLGGGGTGPASDEAARFLQKYAPTRDNFNLYYWYYGTLAMFQHGGPAWERWNDSLRDDLVGLQKISGHASGSWSPQDSRGRYDARGGRIYCTALAAMTLEVYYRYDRVKPADRKPPAVSPPDPTLRRTQGLGRP